MTKLTSSLLILAIILGSGIFLAPRLLGMYYQTQGGSLLEGINSQNSETVLTCAYPADLSGTTFIQLDQATGYLQKAVRVHPKEPQSYLLLGEAFCLRGEPQKAILAYRGYLRLRPDNPLGQIKLGFAYAAACLDRQTESGQTLSAIQNYACADKVLRQLAARHWRKGGLNSADFLAFARQARQAARQDVVLQWYGRAVTAAPARSQPWYELAQYYWAAEEWSLALESVRQGIAVNHHPQGLSNLYFQQGFIQQYRLSPPDPRAAWESYTHALSVDDYYLNPRQEGLTVHQRGVLLAWQHRWEEAVTKYRQALELLPDDYAVQVDLANALWALGEHSAAKEVVSRAIRLSPEKFQAYLALARFFEEEGNIAQAEEMYRKVLDINPQSEEARRALERTR
jgi:tetratricopeptide (TPR) repeat protein